MCMSMEDIKRDFFRITTTWSSLKELQSTLWKWLESLLVKRDERIAALELRCAQMLELKLEFREYKSIVKRAIDIGSMYKCTECGMLNQQHQRCLDCGHDRTEEQEN